MKGDHFMKKLSLLLALILLVTTTGVYATWNYSRNVVDTKQASATAVITGTQSSTKGEIAITNAPKRAIVDDTNADLVAELWFGDVDASSHPVGADQVGAVTVTFTPASQGVDEDVKNNGIKLKWTLTANNLGSYDIDGDGNADPIFVINTAEGLFNSGNPTLSATLNLKDVLTLNIVDGKSITLDTYAEYQAFEAALNGITFTLTVSEVA